jgi:hypothetical protein
MRFCTDCHTEKETKYFHRNRAAWDKSGFANICKECWKIRASKRTKDQRHGEYLNNKQKQLDRDLFKHYGITRNQFNEMRIKQDFLCAICGKHESESHKGLHTDHCHETKRVRGLLCNSCNLAIGMLKHNITILHKAIEYLK